MTKKLSEIGTAVWELYYLPNQEADYIKFSPAERRELVKQAIHSWGCSKWHTTLKTGSSIEIEDFLEEHGL